MHTNLNQNKENHPPPPGKDIDESRLPYFSCRYALVVDDNPGVCDTLACALEIIGFQVMKAENGHEAFELFQKNRCDLVITDFQMPIMNGFTLINRIKDYSPETPIILISGESLEDLSEIGGSESVQEILRKPFPLNRLREAALKAVSS